MRKMQMLALWFGAVTTLFPAAAQTTPALLSVARVQVKPDRLGEWMDVEKQYTAAYKKGGGTLRIVYRNSAGNPYEFMVISSMPNYAALDDKSPYAKGTTETELARMAARRAQCSTAVRTTYERPQPDLGFNTPGTPQPKMVRVTRVNVRQDMLEQFMATVKNELAPALKKAGQTSFLARRVEYGGSRNQFTFRSPLNKFSELDGDSPLIKALGKDGAAKLGAKLGSMGTSEWLIYTVVADLSFQAPQ